MFQVVITPPSSEPASTTASHSSSPKHALSLSVDPSLSLLSSFPPHTSRGIMPSPPSCGAAFDSDAACDSAVPAVTVARVDDDVAGLSAAALAMAREADRTRRLGHTARPHTDVPASSSSCPPPHPHAELTARSLQLPASAPSSPPSHSPPTPSSSSPCLAVAVIPPSPRSSLSTPRRRPSPLTAFMAASSPPPVSSPPSPRTLNSPSYRHPSRLFPALHTDKRGFLLPPVANADLPRTLEGRGDSFWIGEEEEKRKEEERERRRRGMGWRKVDCRGSSSSSNRSKKKEESKRQDGQAAAAQAGSSSQQEQEESKAAEAEDVIDIVRDGSPATAVADGGGDDADVDDDDDDLYWDEVIDAVLQVGDAIVREKQRRLWRRAQQPH